MNCLDDFLAHRHYSSDKCAFVQFEYFLLFASFSPVNWQSVMTPQEVSGPGQREWCSPPKLSQILQQLHKGKHYFQITSLPDISTNTLLQWPQLVGNHFYTSSMGEKDREMEVATQEEEVGGAATREPLLEARHPTLPPSTCIAPTPTRLWKPCRAIIEWGALARLPTADCVIIQKLGQPSRHEGANGGDKDYLVDH